MFKLPNYIFGQLLDHSAIKVSILGNEFYHHENKVACKLFFRVKTPNNHLLQKLFKTSDNHLPQELFIDDYFVSIGVAKCSENDTFDLTTGKKIAYAKAEKEAYWEVMSRLLAFKSDLKQFLDTFDTVYSQFTEKYDRTIECTNRYLDRFNGCQNFETDSEPFCD